MVGDDELSEEVDELNLDRIAAGGVENIDEGGTYLADLQIICGSKGIGRC